MIIFAHLKSNNFIYNGTISRGIPPVSIDVVPPSVAGTGRRGPAYNGVSGIRGFLTGTPGRA